MRSIRLPLPALVIACATLVVACGRGETSSAGDAAVPGAGPSDAPAPFTAERLGGGGTGGLTHVVDGSGSIWSSYEVAAQPAYAFLDDRRMTALAEG